MTESQKAAANVWVDQWVAPLLAQASVFTRGAYKGFLDAHRDELIEGIGGAVLAATVPVAPPPNQSDAGS